MTVVTRRVRIRRLALAGAVLLAGVFLLPSVSSAAASLSLRHSDYPRGTRIVVVPATDVAADRYFSPAHHSSFERLGRVDGSGWLQFGAWHFSTGVGVLRQRHTVLFGYVINQFPTRRAARAAFQDVKLRTLRYRVAHLPARLFISSDSYRSLRFAFFLFRALEVEAYYEYDGVAPVIVANTLRHTFSTQLSHLAHLLRLAVRQPRSTPTPTATPSPLPSPTPSLTLTLVPSSTSTPTPTATIVPTTTATPSPAPTLTATAPPTLTPTSNATATPVALTVHAAMAQDVYHPGDVAVLNVQVLSGGGPVEGAQVEASFHFPNSGTSCSATTDATGAASCTIRVPNDPGTQVEVDVLVVKPYFPPATAMTSFTIGSR